MDSKRSVLMIIALTRKNGRYFTTSTAKYIVKIAKNSRHGKRQDFHIKDL